MSHFILSKIKFRIMCDLRLNSGNYMSRPFCHSLEYLPAHWLPNILNHNTYYYLPIAIFQFYQSIFFYSGVYLFFYKRPCLGKIAFTTSSSYNIGCPTTTFHNTSTHVYTAWGYTTMVPYFHILKICFYISISKSQLHKQWFAILIGRMQESHILSVFPTFLHAPTFIAL